MRWGEEAVLALLLLLLCCAALVGDSNCALPARAAAVRRLLKEAPGLALREVPRGRARLATKINHIIINRWLESYFSSPSSPARRRGIPGLANTSSSSGNDGGAAAGKLGMLGGMGHYVTGVEIKNLTGTPVQPQPCRFMDGAESRPQPRRENLVILPAGDRFNPDKWVDRPELAKFDLVLLYYGKKKDYRCKPCKKVFLAPGTKWKLVYSLYSMKHWKALALGYRAIMVADDDLDMDTCVINRSFEIFHEYGLLMAQPSVCRNPKVHSNWELLYQRPRFVLRYTTFVEIMAPIFDMGLYNGLIAPSTYNAYFGWGLDHIWPFLLRYPKDKIAVIDEVCMGHPPSTNKKGASLYSVPAPISAAEEGRRREKEFNYLPWRVQQMGYEFHPIEVIGAVLRPEGELLASPENATSPPLQAPAPSSWQEPSQLLSANAAAEEEPRLGSPRGPEGPDQGGPDAGPPAKWKDLEEELARALAAEPDDQAPGRAARRRLGLGAMLGRWHPRGLLWQAALLMAAAAAVWCWQQGRGKAGAATARELQ